MRPNEEEIRIDLRRDFGGFCLKVDLQLPPRGVTVLFGPSGSGKTTLLRGIAGLDPEMRGRVSVNGVTWLDTATNHRVPTYQRPIGFVFQDAALFPHLRVMDNLVYGLNRVQAFAESDRYDHVLALLDLVPLLRRYPEKLSGGEAQRVAIARALLSQPKLLLMDEPLASLDAAIKREFLPYLERLHQELDVPLIYVTHAPEELIRLADYVVLMDHGCVGASGSLEQIWTTLGEQTGFGDFCGTVLSGSLGAHHPEDGISELHFQGGSLFVPLQNCPKGSQVRCQIFSSDVGLSILRPNSCSALNVIQVRVHSVFEQPEATQVSVRLEWNGHRLYSTVARKSARDLDLRPGQDLFAQIKATPLSTSSRAVP